MNDTDPLAQLKDIHLPEPLALWIPAIGWWLLALVILITSYWALQKTLQILINRRYRKIALQELASLHQLKNTTDLLGTLNHLLKRTAITAFGRQACASLTNEQWLTFLDMTMPLKSDSFTEGSGKILAEGQYQSHCDYDADALLALSISWIKTHSHASLTKERSNV